MKTAHWIMILGLLCALSIPAEAKHMRGEGMHRHMGMGMGCEQSLPPDKAAMVRKEMGTTMQKNRKLFEQMHSLHEKMHDIAVAEKFDRKAFLATTDAMARLHMKMERNRAEMMADVAARLTAAERKTVADCMATRFHSGEFNRMGKGGRGHHGMDMDNNSHNADTDYRALNR